MPAQVSITWNRQDLARASAPNLNAAVIAATKKGLRDAGRTLKSASVRTIRFRKKIKVKRINDALPLSIVTNGRDLSTFEAKMRVSGEAFPLIAFPNRQVRSGVSVAVNIGGRKIVKHAFIATMKSGHTGIFQRTGKKRLPIEELYSTKVLDVFADSGMVEAITFQSQRVFMTTYERVFPLELAKLK